MCDKCTTSFTVVTVVVEEEADGTGQDGGQQSSQAIKRSCTMMDWLPHILFLSHPHAYCLYPSPFWIAMDGCHITFFVPVATVPVIDKKGDQKDRIGWCVGGKEKPCWADLLYSFKPDLDHCLQSCCAVWLVCVYMYVFIVLISAPPTLKGL